MVVLKRTLDIGINGYPSPSIPKGPRSIRRRALRPKALQGGQICPFELLATVAGKLLEVSECSSASSSAAVGFDQHKICTKKEPLDVNKPFGGVRDDQGSSEGSAFSSWLPRDICKGKHETAGEAIAEHVSSPFTNSVCSDKVNSDPKSTTPKSHVEFVKLSSIVEGDSPKYGEYNNTNIDNKATGQVDINKSPAATDFEEKVELPLFRDSNPNGSFLKQGDDVKLGCKDDDEIHLRYSIHNNNSNNTEKGSRSPTHPGDARIRKFMSPKYWKTAPKLKDYEDSNTGGRVKDSYLNKRPCYDIDRSQRDTPFKKRKLFDRSSVVTQDGGFSCESVSNSPLKSVDNEKNGSAGKLHEGNRTTSSNFVSQKSCNLRNSNVRLSIKSFKVPELFIEVPETTTVASLKRTVSEAVTTILCGGLRVGVLLQGKKIRDDSRTLHQTGISRNDDINTIEFTLEPDTPTKTPPPPPICRKDPPPAPLSCETPKFVNRCQINPKDDMFNFETRNKPATTDSNSPSRSYGELVPSPTSELKDRKSCYDLKALVPVLGASMEALAMMPVSQRPKRSEMGQRRTRRPFSVSEVEALVHAVEKLGTGRWRDVKLCAFDNAKHRTYVDLKDKWKTLVHTARISPQQRRGEPVPQDLLDRVLAAQSYWSDHQAKQHGKHQHQAVVPRPFHSPTQKS